MKNRFKHILLGGIILFLFLPLIQNNFHFFKVKELSGDYVPAANIGINYKNWWNKEFQEKKEKYINDHFGLREKCIRIHNQIAFSLFKTSNANSVVIGKNNYLYEENYINAYYGSDFIGIDSIHRKMWMVRFLKDTLEKQGKTLLLVFAPGKGAYYPEFIPDNKKTIKGITNIEVYLRYAQQFHIPHIDFHTWFNQNKGKTKYPLIPKYGIHWSDNASLMAMDSMIKKIESLRNIDMINPYSEKTWEGIPDGHDNDIERGMNIFFQLKPELHAYPEVRFESDSGKVKPSVIMVADSYYWQMIFYGISNCFNLSDYWYYFERAHNPTYEHSKPIEEIDVYKEMDRHEVIIIMATDANLNKFGWNFIETMFKHYNGKLPALNTSLQERQRLIGIKKGIMSDAAWMSSIREKAQQKQISVDSMLTIDALWVVEKQKK